ncbi:hypothetical protein C8Q80DRAFT_23056 [Daedaleopsis nitida]|nr:hypothetical protein C8Q80DRAFT_23056 [Daedaleopsis nitida]
MVAWIRFVICDASGRGPSCYTSQSSTLRLSMHLRITRHRTVMTCENCRHRDIPRPSSRGQGIIEARVPHARCSLAHR